MPRGVFDRSKAAPRGSKLTTIPLSSTTQQLLQYQRDLEERLAASKAKDKAMAMITQLAQAHGLTPKDLREIAVEVGKRPKGDAPVMSLNLKKAQHAALARKLTEARIAKGITNADICKALKKGSGNVSQWFTGVARPGPTVQPKLIKLLDLPKNFFEPLANGHAPGG